MPSMLVNAMRVTGFDGEDGVVGESCDVDMGTPTACNNSLSDWRDTHDRSGELDSGRLDRWRIHSGEDEETVAVRAPQPLTTSPSASSCESVVRPVDVGRQEESAETGTVEILAFREYNDADIDNLDIQLSQDFAGEALDDDTDSPSAAPHNIHPTRLSPPDSCAWLDFRDGTQLCDEEASEVFDNVIYAPPTLPVRVASTSPLQRRDTPSPTVPPVPVSDPSDLYESESELSDAEGYVVPHLKSSSLSPPPSATASPPVALTSQPSSASGSPPAAASSVQWSARTSVKRDCSFIDHTLKHRRKHLSVQDLSESGEEFEEKLKLVDGDDDCDSGSRHARSYLSMAPTAVDKGVLLPGFRPKKKRRKVRQLALDAFLKVQPSTSY